MTRIHRLVPGLLVAVVAWCAAMVVPLVSGAFWPIAVAPRIWHEHALSFTTDAISSLPIEGGSWVVQPWLPALAMWGAYGAGGVALLSLLNAFLAAACAWLAYRVAREHATPVAAAATVLAVLPLLAPHTLKSQQFALVAAPALYLLASSRAWLALPVLVALWSNLHGSAPVGVVVAACAALGLVRRPGREAEPGRSQRDGRVPRTLGEAGTAWRLVWVAACAVALLANPLGPGFIDYVTDVQQVPGLEALTPVWRPLDPLSWRGVWVLALAGTLLVAGATAGHGRNRLRQLGFLVPVAIFTAMAFDAQRNVVWLAIAAVPELAVAVERFRVRVRVPGEVTSSLIAVTFIVVLAFGVVGLLPQLPFQHRLAIQAQPPATLLNAIPEDAAVFASAEWADYLRIKRGAQVFVDARLERYRRADLDAYLDATGEGEASLLLCTSGGRNDPLQAPFAYVLARDRTAGRLQRTLSQYANSGAPAGTIVHRIASSRHGVVYRIECSAKSGDALP